MQIAVVLETELKTGGGFQQELSTASLLNKHQDAHEFIFYTTLKEDIEILKKLGIKAKYLKARSIYSRVYYHLAGSKMVRKLCRAMKIAWSPFERAFINDDIDLIYFLSPSHLCQFITRNNYMVTIWDLCYRDQPEFPEISFNGQFEKWEDLTRNSLFKAVAVLTNFETIKADIVRRYGCDPERIYVAKFLPSNGIKADCATNIREKYSLKERYIFYPAQFWSGKNHVYILDGLKLLRDKFGIDIDAVFSGSDMGNLKYVLNYARKLGLEKRVRYVGFVPHGEIPSFYKQAIALVMPTYFSPTNIPPLEAFALECPVCYSDLPGSRDHVRDAAFLMNLDDPESMARHIITILNDPEVVRAKVKRGRQLLSEWTEDDYWNVLKEIFDKYARKLRCWKESKNTNPEVVR